MPPENGHITSRPDTNALPENRATGQGRQLAQNPPKKVRVLGIDFFNGSLDEAVNQTLAGGLVVAPSGPGLASLDRNPPYQQALCQADIVLVDSGFLALCQGLIKRQSLKRISGLRFLEALLRHPGFSDTRTHYWIMPTAQECETNLNYLRKLGLLVIADQTYVAPHYNTDNKIEDEKLLDKILKQRPRFIMINIAGGKQEILGSWLQQSIHLRDQHYRPAIVCTGAAIAFLTGRQAPIPLWVDRFYLGWLHRILHNPKRYLGRYLAAWRLLWLILRSDANAVKTETKESF